MSESHREWTSFRSAKGAAQRAADLIEVLLVPEPDPAAVAEVLRAHGELDPIELTGEDLGELRAAAAELRAVFAARDVGEAAERLNALFAAHAGPPRLTSHGGAHDWHLHTDAHDDAPWGQWLRTSSGLALAVLLAERQALPGGICAAPSCEKSFVDTGAGGPRRYCSTRCSTRQRVAAHRAHRRE
ncbi:CGNR zinc finger domain-containing protein [Amycolatopsis nigrescens]|uniref:CGNR zinc finger domain-containing protein n=1 Tax=Amycolatopsis nigrescens TaxID=381445 RepID=UPI000377E446|nr:CGNR zinc finger domain-containing protein [Amycolatopsis nigrescens]